MQTSVVTSAPINGKHPVIARAAAVGAARKELAGLGWGPEEFLWLDFKEADGFVQCRATIGRHHPGVQAVVARAEAVHKIRSCRRG